MVGWREPCLPRTHDYELAPEDNRDNIVDFDARCPMCKEYVLKWEQHIHYPGKNGNWEVYHVDCLLDDPYKLFGMFGTPIEEE